jgi:hypothetical protein
VGAREHKANEPEVGKFLRGTKRFDRIDASQRERQKPETGDRRGSRGLKYRLVNIDQNDHERAREVVLPLDGRDVTWGAGQRFSFRRVNELTFERVNKDNAGRIVSVLRTEVSRDGKVLSQTTTLAGASSPATGQSAGDSQIFTRRSSPDAR